MLKWLQIDQGFESHTFHVIFDPFFSLGAVHKLRYAIEVGGWLVKYNH